MYLIGFIGTDEPDNPSRTHYVESLIKGTLSRNAIYVHGALYYLTQLMGLFGDFVWHPSKA